MFGVGWPVFLWKGPPTRGQDGSVPAVDGSSSDEAVGVVVNAWASEVDNDHTQRDVAFDGVQCSSATRRATPRKCGRRVSVCGARGQRIGEAKDPGPKNKVLRGPHLSGRTHQRTQLDSDSDAPLTTGGRFGPLSSDDETFSVRVSPAQVALDSGVNGTPVRIAVLSSAPSGLKRLRLTRMSEATPVIALSGEIHVARPRQATWDRGRK